VVSGYDYYRVVWRISSRRLTMSEGMLGKLSLSETQGPRSDLETKLAGPDGPQWLEGLNRFLRKENPWPKSQLLKRLATVTTKAMGKFVAKDHFRPDNQNVTINHIDENFKSRFLGLTQEAIGADAVVGYELTKDSLDQAIIAELGANHQTTVSHLWFLLTKQANGENGALLTNGRANIFYIRGISGNLWAVTVDWDGRGWNVNAHSIDGLRWYAGVRFFCR